MIVNTSDRSAEKSEVNTAKKELFQIIRGFSCLFICLNHCALFNKYSFGECGVDFFIVVSGYLTAMNAAKSSHLRRTYLFDKVKKILPLYWFSTLILFFIGVSLPFLFSTPRFSIEDLFRSLFLVPGRTFILYPGWTLTFFFIFYVVYFLSDRLSSHISVNRDLLASFVTVLLVFLGYLYKYISGNTILHVWFNPILIEFVYGIFLHVIINRFSVLNRNYKVLSFVIIILLFFDYNKYLGPRVLLPAILVCICVVCLHGIRTESWTCRLLSHIGNISFVIYILHPIIIRPLDKLLVRIVGGSISVWYILGALMVVTVCVLVCWCIEPLFRRIHLC